MKNMPKLLPCPFCGGFAELKPFYAQKTLYGVKAQCAVCGAETHPVYTDQNPKWDNMENDDCLKAAIAWNNRVNRNA